MSIHGQRLSQARPLKSLVLGTMPRRWLVPSRYWYRWARGRLDQELALARTLVRPGSTAIDVGANVGVYTYGFLRAGARVEAFEPQPRCRDVLTAYGSPRVHVHGVALSSAPGVLPLHVPIYDGHPEPGHATFRAVDGPHETVEVPVRTLDEFEFRNVSLLKVDVEGHELDVLRGATKTLARERPVLLLEMDQAFLPFPVRDAFEVLGGYGYEGYFMDNGRLRSAAQVLGAEATKVGADGINNFFFLHAGDERALSLVATRLAVRGQESPNA